jgi:hypothetical protein
MARSPVKPKKQRRDKKSLGDKCKAKIALEQTYSEAVAWCIENDVGARKCESSGKFPSLKYATLQRRLIDSPEVAKKSAVLTPLEERELVEFLVESNKEKKGLGRKATNVVVVHMLETRHAMRRMNWLKKYSELSACAHRALRNGGPGTSRDTHTLSYIPARVDQAGSAPDAQCNRHLTTRGTPPFVFQVMLGIGASRVGILSSHSRRPTRWRQRASPTAPRRSSRCTSSRPRLDCRPRSSETTS